MEFASIQKKIMELELPDMTIDNVEQHPEGPIKALPGLPFGDAPAHVQVELTCRPEPGSDIRVLVWLPTGHWNGDLLCVGNGGSAGMLIPFMMVSPLRLGFAVANTDLGTSAGPDCGIGNPAVWKDFGHRATHLMAVAAKAMVKSYFGRQPAHAYFSGSSTGGQQAFSAAQRYPEDYDGILAITPAFDRVNLHLAFLHDWLAVNKGQAGLFSQEDAEKITRLFLAECGAQGGRKGEDAFFYRPHAIEVTAQLLEKAGLTPAQVKGLMKLYQGVTDPVIGQRLYESTMVPGSEACDMGLAYRCTAPAFEHDMFYLFRWVLGVDFDFSKFDFHNDAQILHAQLDEHLNATDPDLSAFRARGGKLLLLHGTADPIIPYTSSVRYYEQVRQAMGDVSDFFRLFLIPGMAHTSGGPGLQDVGVGLPATPKDSKHLALLALKEWVETGCAPSTLYPVAFRDNNFANGFLPDGVSYERAVEWYNGDK